MNTTANFTIACRSAHCLFERTLTISAATRADAIEQAARRLVRSGSTVRFFRTDANGVEHYDVMSGARTVSTMLVFNR